MQSPILYCLPKRYSILSCPQSATYNINSVINNFYILVNLQPHCFPTLSSLLLYWKKMADFSMCHLNKQKKCLAMMQVGSTDSFLVPKIKINVANKCLLVLMSGPNCNVFLIESQFSPHLEWELHNRLMFAPKQLKSLLIQKFCWYK